MPVNALCKLLCKDHGAIRGRLGRARVALLTITAEEFETVRDVFHLNSELGGSPYAVSSFNRTNDYQIVLRRASAQTNVIAGDVARAILEDFRPQYLFLIGTAGGHSERESIKLGDVVIANYIDYSGYWKLKNGRYEERKNACDHPSLHLLENFVEGLRRNPGDWVNALRKPRPDQSVPKALIGGIVAGELLLGDADNAFQQKILTTYQKALAFEMESFGVARTMYSSRWSVHYNPQFLIVRGISDLVDRDPVDNQGQREAWTPLAVEAAATFTRILIDRLFKYEADDSPLRRTG